MTLVESMITISLLLVVVVAIFASLESAAKSQAYQADRTQTLDDMRGVLNRMTKDLRQATSVDETSTGSSVTFVTYINGVNTTIVYTASGTTLTRKVGSATAFTVLTRLASTNLFVYQRADATTGIQWVEINLQAHPARTPDTTLVLDSEVNLRNRTIAEAGSS